MEVMDGFIISPPIAIGYLEHEPTKAQIAVYSKIGWFKRLMLKWCFGLKYVKLNK